MGNGEWGIALAALVTSSVQYLSPEGLPSVNIIISASFWSFDQINGDFYCWYNLLLLLEKMRAHSSYDSVLGHNFIALFGWNNVES